MAYTGTLPSSTLAVGDALPALWTQEVSASIASVVGITTGIKNALINAVGFPVNQRGSASYAATGYTADRWLFTLGTGATSTIGVAAPTPGTVPGFIRNYVAWNRTVAGTAACTFEQRVESVSTFAGQTVTVTVVCNTASGSVDFTPSLVQNFGTGGSPSGTATTTGALLTATTTVQTLTASIAVPSISGKTLGTGGNDFLSLVLTRAYNATNGATGQLNIYAVQVELGSAGTALEVPAVQETLAACQRYYSRFDFSAYTNCGCGASGFCDTTTVAQLSFAIPVPMRANPTFAVDTVGSFLVYSSGGVATSCSGLTATVNSPFTATISATASAATLTAGRAALLVHSASASGCWFDFSAEL